MRKINAAAIQMVSTDDLSANLAQASDLIERAAAAGAELVVLPENFAFMGKFEGAVLAVAESPDGSGVIQHFLATQAVAHGITLVGGSVPIASEQGDKAYACSIVYGPDGDCLARYHKLHLFDVDLPGGEGYRESATFLPGHSVALAHAPPIKLGLSICYDLRFPELYRELAQQGAEVLLVPSAFTATTGAAHWSALLRARAIENLCYVVAPNQGGVHASGRETYGHSMIVDPWGQVIAAQTERGSGVVSAIIDLAEQQTLRARFPVLTHSRLGIQGIAER